MLQRSAAHAATAANYGALYIGQYEGDSHDTLQRDLRKVVGAAQFQRNWHAGPHHAAVIKRRATEWRKRFPNAMSANYQHYCRGLGDAASPWCDAVPWGSPKAAEAEILLQLRQ